MDIYIYLGPPGSGKGTISQLCMKELGWVQLSTGDLCRKHIAENTEIGKKIDFDIKSGKLLSDSLIAAMIQDWLDKMVLDEQTVILDGFPRTVAQANILESFFPRYNGAALRVRVVKFLVDDAVVVERLSKRIICQNKNCQKVYSLTGPGHEGRLVCDVCSCSLIRRKDDEEEAIRKRLLQYHQHAHEIVEYYMQIGRPIIELAVDRPVEGVFEEFKRLVGVNRDSN